MAKKLVLTKKDFLTSKIPQPNESYRVSIRHIATGISIKAEEETEAWTEMMFVLSNHYNMQAVIRKDE